MRIWLTRDNGAIMDDYNVHFKKPTFDEVSDSWVYATDDDYTVPVEFAERLFGLELELGDGPKMVNVQVKF